MMSVCRSVESRTRILTVQCTVTNGRHTTTSGHVNTSQIILKGLAMNTSELMDIDEVRKVAVDRNVLYHGAPATEVTVVLADGRTVTGVFTTEDREAFGGVEFSSRKDIPRLMRSKVLAVIEDRAETS